MTLSFERVLAELGETFAQPPLEPAAGTDSGVANAYVYTHSGPLIATLSTGTLIRFTPTHANTGASTINVNGTGVVAIVGAAGAALAGGELTTLGPVQLQYNGTAWQILSTTGATVVSGLAAAGTDSGAVNAYVYTHNALSLAATLAAGTLIRFIPANTNTGASTLNADGTGAVAVIRANGSALTGGELSSLGPVVLQSTGTQWQIVSTAGAQPGFERTAAEVAAALIPSSYGYLPDIAVDVRRYGMVADGATDNTTLLQNALTANANYAPTFYPVGASFYKLTARVTAPANTRMIMAAQAELRWTSTSLSPNFFTGSQFLRCGLEVVGDNFTIEGQGKITGPATAAAGSGAGGGGVTAFVLNESGISRVGASSLSRGKGFSVRDVEISLWGSYGVATAYMQDVLIINHVVHDVGLAGVIHHSPASVREYFNKVYGVQPGSNGDVYGISHDHDSTNYNTDPMVLSPITAITQAASAVVTVNVTSGSNPWSIGQQVYLDHISGMTQINGLNATISAIGGSSGAWTFTIPINSSGFAAFIAAPTISAISKQTAAVVTFSNASAANPYQIGNVVLFAGVNGMTQINGLYARIMAAGGSSGAWTITISLDTSGGGFSAYTSGGTTSGAMASNPRQAANPFPIDMDCAFNEIRDVWVTGGAGAHGTALDSHGGLECRYHHNATYNCHRGVQIASGSGAALRFSGENSRIEDNAIYGYQYNGNATTDANGLQAGVVANGGLIVPARGLTVARNHFYAVGHANASPTVYCIESSFAQGIVIDANTFHACVGRGIYGTLSSGIISNNFWDSVGSSATGSYCIYLDSYIGPWSITGNMHATNTGTFTPYTNGFFISSVVQAPARINWANNDFTICGTPITQLSTQTTQLIGAVTVTQPNTNVAALSLVQNNSAGKEALHIQGNGLSSLSNGLRILAGTNASDFPLAINNDANAVVLMQLVGNGMLQVPGSPLVASATQVSTGVAAFLSSDAPFTSNAVLANVAGLSITLNELGKYAIEVWLAFWEATSGAGGFQFDLNGGASTIGTILAAVDGFSTVAIGNAALTSISTAQSQATISTTTGAPSWFLLKGFMQVTGAGTFIVRAAQAASNANTTTLKTGSYIQATKIG